MATSTVSDVQSQTSDNVISFVSAVVNKIPALFLAILVFFAAFLLAKIVKAWAQRSVLKSGSNEGAMNIVGKTAYIGTIVLGLTVALKILEIDISFIVAAMGFGLGFAMKDILENYFSGVLILVQKPFSVGDTIKAGEYVGKVEEIEARATFLRVFDGQRVIIPNSNMISGAVINYSSFPERRVNVDFSVSYDANLQTVSELILQLMKSHPKIMQEPSPNVTIKGFGNSNIDLQAHFWVDRSQANWIKLNTEIKRRIKETLDQNGIGVSYQVVTLNVNNHDSGDIYNVMNSHVPERKPQVEMAIPPSTPAIENESSMHLEPIASNENPSVQG
ncbi:MAG: mechanosensitive ion channel [Candidatus Abawacabacteria bacterium]|nr:mechanosensitive ion channel [Candidatus Abawacabacteria bacterium]